jgi:putative ABC transport system permease protein
MRNAFVTGWRSIVEGRRRAFLTGISTALGVGLLTASVLGGLSARQAVVRGVESLVSIGDVGVVPAPGEEFIRTEDLPALASLTGVNSVLPSLSRSTVVSASGADDEPMLVTGVPVDADSLASGLIESGRLPDEGRDELLVPSGLAHEWGLALGDSLDLATPSGPSRFVVVGMVDGASLGVFGQGHVFTSLEAVRSAFGVSGSLTRIDLDIEPSALDGWASRHHRDLPAGARFQDTAAITAGVEPIALAVSAATGLVATMALVLSTILGTDASLSAVRSRRRTYAALRAVGASRRWVAASVLAETIVVAGVGIAGGVVLGLMVGWFGAEARPSVAHLALAAAAGVLGGVVAAGAGARRALHEVASIAPALQLRDEASAPSPRRLHRRAVQGAAVVSTSALIVVAFRAESTIAVALGLVSCAAACVLAARWSVTPALGIASRHVRAGALLGGTNGAGRGPITAMVALVVFSGVALSATVGAVSTATVTQIQRQFGADVQVTSTVPLADVPEFDELPGVRAVASAVTGTGLLRAGSAELELPLQAVDGRAWFGVAQLPWLETSDTDGAAGVASGSAIALPRGVADALDVGRGDHVVLKRGGVDIDVVVAGTFTSVATGQQAIIDLSLGRRLGLDGLSRWDIAVASPTRTDEVTRRAGALVDGQPGVQVITGRETRERATTEVAALTAGLFVVVAMSLGLGAIAASSAVSSNVESRRREFATLRAIGAGRGVIARLVAVDVGVMAFVGVLLGAALGQLGGALGTRLVGGLLGLAVPHDVDPAPVAITVSVAWITLALAAVPPTRAALRIDPLSVMRSARGAETRGPGAGGRPSVAG